MPRLYYSRFSLIVVWFMSCFTNERNERNEGTDFDFSYLYFNCGGSSKKKKKKWFPPKKQKILSSILPNFENGQESGFSVQTLHTTSTLNLNYSITKRETNKVNISVCSPCFRDIKIQLGIHPIRKITRYRI